MAAMEISGAQTKIKHKHHCYFVNIQYGIYGIINSNLFRYPIKTVDSKVGTKEKRGIKFGNTQEKNRKKHKLR